MSRPTASLRQRMRNREPLLGPLLRMPNETLIELSGHAGLDFVLVDTEHGPSDQLPLGAHLTTATAVGLPALVRVGHPGEILRVLDLGADGIVVPHVSSAAEAEAAVRAAHYPPRGDRGFAVYSRAGRQGLATPADHLAAAAQTVVIAMIEDAAGVAAAADIAAVDGIDALFVGPGDLSTAMGFPGRPGHPEVLAAIDAVQQAAAAAGVGWVSIVADEDTARARFATGSTMVIYNTLAALGRLFLDLATGRPGPAPTSPGARPPLVLLPGMLSTPDVWGDVAARLSDAGLTVLPMPVDRDDSVAAMAATVLGAAPEVFDLAGHSLGGIVALEIVRQAPGRVRRLVLANTSGHPPREDQLADWAALSDSARGGGFAAVVDEQARQNLGPAADGRDRVERWRRMAHEVGPDGLLRQLRAQTDRPDSRPGLGSISVPTLVVTGERDEISPRPLQQALADGIAGARHEVIAGAGHMTPMDAADALAALLTDFLS